MHTDEAHVGIPDGGGRRQSRRLVQGQTLPAMARRPAPEDTRGHLHDRRSNLTMQSSNPLQVRMYMSMASNARCLITENLIIHTATNYNTNTTDLARASRQRAWNHATTPIRAGDAPGYNLSMPARLHTTQHYAERVYT